MVYGIEFRLVPKAISPLEALQAAEKWAAQAQADYHACKCPEEFCRHLEDSSLADITLDLARKAVAESGGNPWTYEGYWAVVLGANRSADDVVAEFKLDVTDRGGLDQWLATAEVEAWRVGAKGGPVPSEWTGHHSEALNELEQVESAMIKGYTLRDDGGSTEEITATDLDDAREQAREWVADGEWNLDEGPAHIDVRIERGGETVDTITVHLEQNPPKCEGKHEHDWASPLSVVGGISENPGVWGHGGGVTISSCCTRCGAKRIVDTAATDSSGRTCEETRYEARAYRSDPVWQELNEQMYPD
jgi:hypothetical protein